MKNILTLLYNYKRRKKLCKRQYERITISSSLKLAIILNDILKPKINTKLYSKKMSKIQCKK